MDIDRNRDANQGRKSVILSFPFFIATMSNIFVPLLKGWGEVLKTSGMCQVPRQAEILLKEEHNRLGDGFSPTLGSALRPLVLRSVSKKLSSQLFCSSRLSILHSEYFYADHPILNWSYNKYWKKYNLCPSNSASSGRHRLLRHSSIKHLLRMWYAPGKGKLSEVKIKTTAFALKEFTQSSHQFSSVQFSCSVVSDSLRPHGLQHSRPPCPSATPGVYSNWCPLSRLMPSNHLILCCPLLLLPSIFPSIRVFSNESALCIRWPKYWSFSFNVSPSNEYSVLISFRLDWLDLVAVQGILKHLLQHHSSKASILWCSAFFIVQLSHPYMTTGKTIALTSRTFVGTVMSLLFNKSSHGDTQIKQ